MEYTVREVSKMTGVTVKALHYYHRIGLLLPCRVTQAGYRLYGEKELERLQQILFYRELDFSLAEIKRALGSESDRAACLRRQEKLLCARRRRTDRLIETVRASIRSASKGEPMSTQELFRGFDRQGWEEALAPQREYLRENYGADLNPGEIDPAELNEKAAEAKRFMDSMARALRDRVPAGDEDVRKRIGEHLRFLNGHGNPTDARAFRDTVRFLSRDEFHRGMMESQQIGLSYFLLAAAECFAEDPSVRR